MLTLKQSTDHLDSLVKLKGAAALCGVLSSALLGNSAQAQNCTGVTYSFSSGSTAVASQVNRDFTDVTNCINALGTSTTTLPLIVGGAAPTSSLTLRSTSGNGTTGADIKFQVGNNGSTEAMRLLNNGNVGIGTATPSQSLDVNGAIQITRLGSQELRLNGGSGNQWRMISTINGPTDGRLDITNTTDDFETVFTTPLSLTSDGNVGIGTSSPGRTLSVVGTVGFSSSLGTGPGGNNLCIDTTTYEVVRGNGSVCIASSARFKENVRDLRYGLSEILALRPVSYNYRPSSNMGAGVKLGFIAEEMQRVLPEVVTLDNQGQVFGIDYPVLTAVLTNAVKELKIVNDSYAAQITTMRAENGALKEQLAALSEHARREEMRLSKLETEIVVRRSADGTTPSHVVTTH